MKALYTYRDDLFAKKRVVYSMGDKEYLWDFLQRKLVLI